jgi:hypothetical protein
MLRACKKTNVAPLSRMFAHSLTNESRESVKKVKIFRLVYTLKAN